MKFLNLLTNFFKKNLDKKLIAFLAACLLWLYVDTVSTIKKEFKADIIYKDMPKNLIPLKSPKSLIYYIIGNKYFSSNLKAPNISFEVSLKNCKEGFNLLDVHTIFNSPIPPSVHIEPSKDKINVFMDKKVSKKVEVKLKISHLLSPDYKISSLSVSPSFALVEGAQSLIKSLRFLETEQIHILQPDSYRLKKKIISPFDELKIVPTDVDIKFEMKANIVEQTVFLPISIIGLSERLEVKKISAKKILCTIKGLPSQIKKVDFKKLFYYIDVKDYKNPGFFHFATTNQYFQAIDITPLKVKRIDIELKKKGKK